MKKSFITSGSDGFLELKLVEQNMLEENIP